MLLTSGIYGRQVDAALDPTNVSKLARYVRDQAEKEVQFLIISLKSTLYILDPLFGQVRTDRF